MSNSNWKLEIGNWKLTKLGIGEIDERTNGRTDDSLTHSLTHCVNGALSVTINKWAASRPLLTHSLTPRAPRRLDKFCALCLFVCLVCRVRSLTVHLLTYFHHLHPPPSTLHVATSPPRHLASAPAPAPAKPIEQARHAVRPSVQSAHPSTRLPVCRRHARAHTLPAIDCRLLLSCCW